MCEQKLNELSAAYESMKRKYDSYSEANTEVSALKSQLSDVKACSFTWSLMSSIFEMILGEVWSLKEGVRACFEEKG